MAEQQTYCREQAKHEPIVGTAKGPLRRWVLVEDGCPWKAKLPRDSQLPPPVRERLAQIDSDPHTRLQLIRRPGEGKGERRRVFVVDGGETGAGGGRRIAETELSLDELASLDPDTLSARASSRDELAALWLVCTHGSRDRCCAKWGIALWEALARSEVGERVWQSSHLGGHRFAPTFLALPSGLMYGRFELDALEDLRTELAAGRVGALDRLRGRCTYPPAAQRVEVELRTRNGWREDGQLRLLAYEELGDDRFEVRFQTPSGSVRTIVEPRADVSVATPSNCGDEPSPRRLYALRRVS